MSTQTLEAGSTAKDIVTQAWTAYANNEIDDAATVRALASHDRYLYATADAPDGSKGPALIEYGDTPVSFLFADRDAVARASAAFDLELTHAPAPGWLLQAIAESWGDRLKGFAFNPGSRHRFEFTGPGLARLLDAARAVRVERLIADPGEDQGTFRRVLLGYENYRVPFLRDGEKWLPMRITGNTGQAATLVFTAQDCADAFLATAPPDSPEETMWATLDGRQLFETLPSFGAEKILFNVAGPADKAVLDASICDYVLRA